MATALALVNRVRRQLRWGDTAAFDDDQSKVVLDRVNDAIATIFGIWDWECDLRHDGTVTCIPQTSASYAGLDAARSWVIPEASLFYNLAPTDSAQACAFSYFAVVTSSTTYNDQAIRISSVANASSNDTVGLDQYWYGSTGTQTVLTGCNQIVLPAACKRVVGVRQQDRGVALRTADYTDRDLTLPRILFKPHETVNDDLAIAYVGAQRTSTSWSVSGVTQIAARTGPTLVLWPTPLSAYRIDYSYYRNRVDLSATTDELDGADRYIEDLVVSLAFARCTQDAVGDANATDGLALEQRVLERASALHGNQGYRERVAAEATGSRTQQPERGR